MLQYSYLSWETTEEAVPKVYQCKGKVLVEEVTQEITHAEVGPASMHQQESLQEPKLSKGIIWCQNSLHPLLSADANTNVCSWGRNTQFGSQTYETRLLKILRAWKYLLKSTICDPKNNTKIS